MKRRWFLFGGAAAAAAAALPIPAAALPAVAAPAAAPDLPIGFVMSFKTAAGAIEHTIYAGNGVHLLADGGYASIAEYPQLYKLLNTMFGFKIGDGSVFGLPTLSKTFERPYGWGDGMADTWNNEMLPILSKEPGPTYQPDEAEIVEVDPIRGKTVDDAARPLPDYWDATRLSERLA